MKFAAFKLMSLFAVIGVTHLAHAKDESPYYYGGSCGLQGSWTTDALENTRDLRSYLSRIKDDENCKKLPETLQATFDKLDAELAEAKKSGGDSDLGNLPREIGALRNYLSTSRDMSNGTIALMTQKLVRHAAAGYATPIAESKADRMKDLAANDNASEKDLASLKLRMDRSVSAGISLLNSTIDTLPQVEQCISDEEGDVKFGQFLAATVRVAGAFASSSQSNTTAFARTITKLAEYTRQQRYAEALAKLANSEFLAALSCIMEVTEENFCAARDGQILVKEMNKKSEVYQDSKGELKLRAIRTDKNPVTGDTYHPLEGYYVLTQNLPQLTEWLLAIQLGVEPNLPTDSEQKIKPVRENADFYEIVFRLQGVYKEGLTTLSTYNEHKRKQNQVVGMAKSLNRAIISGGMPGNGVNFFTLADQPMHILFKLLGIETPPEVLGSNASGFQQDPERWLEANYEKLPVFNQPDKLAADMGENMRGLVRRAEGAALAYYSQWFLVDKVAIVNKSLVGHTYNVKESLTEVDKYLLHLEGRINKYAKDKSMLPGIRDTRIRIRKVLAKYKELENLAGSVETIGDDRLTPELLAKSEDIIEEVFNQFMVLLAKSNWLANRLTDFVQYDFNLMQRSGVNMEPYINEIYLATGRSMVNQMVTSAAASPSAVDQDLAMALKISKSNIEALETALAPSFIDKITDLNHIVKGIRRVTDYSKVQEKRGTFATRTEEIPGDQRNIVLRYLNGVGEMLFPAHVVENPKLFTFTNPFKYNLVSRDDEFGSARRVRDLLCVQTLGFNDLRPFWNLCSEVELRSPYSDSFDSRVPESLRATLNVNYRAKAWEDYKSSPEKNHSKRICAARDYNRRNLVLYLLQGQTRAEQGQ